MTTYAGPVYGQYASESGAGIAWTNPENMDGEPDTVEATASLLSAESTKTASIIFGDNLGALIPAWERVISLDIAVAASDSASDLESATQITVQLQHGVLVGVSKAKAATSSAITTYTFTGNWGTALTRNLIENLRVALTINAGNASDVGVDSVWIENVRTVPRGGLRDRARCSRGR